MMKKSNFPIAALREILNTHVAFMDEEALHSTLEMLVGNLNAHVALQLADYPQPVRMALDGTPLAEEAGMSGEPGNSGEPVPFINVMRLEGDVLRNSGMCSQGSMDMKEDMMQAVDAGATAHIIIINSGGGSAYSVYDYRDMIDYAREAGQPVIAYIRGCACSAAYALAMMCDKILCFSEHDLVGSIGCLCAVNVATQDKENQYSFQTLRIVYADKSTKKNNAYREAVKGNMEPYRQMANDLCLVFHDLVRQYRPQAATDEYLTGDHYDACDVLGNLVDEVGVPFQRAVDLAFSMAEDRKLAQRKAGTTWK